MKKKNYANIIKSYKEYSKESGFDFVASDLEAIGNSSTDKYDLISNALMIGFMVGYDRANAEKSGAQIEGQTNADRAEAAALMVWGAQDTLNALEYLLLLFQNENNFDMTKPPEECGDLLANWRNICLTLNHTRATLTAEAEKLEKAFDVLQEIK